MLKSEPIIAVKDVESSSALYQQLLGLKSMHGGSEFEILVNADGEVILCLHEWDGHPSMSDPNITPGNGLILYFRTDAMEDVRQKAKEMNLAVEEEIHMNPNSRNREFSVRDLDGYYLTISEFHIYEG